MEKQAIRESGLKSAAAAELLCPASANRKATPHKSALEKKADKFAQNLSEEWCGVALSEAEVCTVRELQI